MKFFKSHSQDNEKIEIKNIDTVIGAEAVFDGTLISSGSICIEGRLKGRIACKGSVLINRRGDIDADITARHVVVNGMVTGNITACKQLDIGSSGKVMGDVEAAALTIAKGGILDGFCNMMKGSSLEEPELPGLPDTSDERSPDTVIVPAASDDGQEAPTGNGRIHIIEDGDEVGRGPAAAEEVEQSGLFSPPREE